MSNYQSVVNIPAYDSASNGLIVNLKLTVTPKSAFEIETTGVVATALARNFKRTIEVMASMKQSWECLESNAYQLECNNDQYIVKDAKSSSLAFSIALINVCRAIEGKVQIPGLSGTGILRIDGSFEGAHLEDKKHLAAKNSMKSLKEFITPHECKHLFDLEYLINKHH